MFENNEEDPLTGKRGVNVDEPVNWYSNYYEMLVCFLGRSWVGVKKGVRKKSVWNTCDTNFW